MVDRNNAIDLHGLTVDEALAAFVEHYNSRVRSGRGGCIKVVHGYGSSGEGGVIRGRLLRLLASHADKLRYEDGQQYGNPGWTLVYPGELLPGRQDTLDHRILGLCQEPKS